MSAAIALTSLLACLTAATAKAQYVVGNEAVRLMPDGSTRVETPPTTLVRLAKPCAASNPGCTSDAWRMVETQLGLMECTEIYARPSTCRTSTYGAVKRSRLWIVKTRGQWMQCSYPDLGKGCVSTQSLPSPKVQ